MLTLYIVRHGQTEWNVENRMQGHLDSPLTNMGIQQARQLKSRLDGLLFDAVLISPSMRTQQTAKILEPQSSFHFKDERLLEMNLGPWQGLTLEEIKRDYPNSFYQYYHQPECFQLPRGETFMNVRKRMESWLNEQEQTYLQGNLLIVTHGVITKTFLQIALGQELSRFWATPMVEGCSLSILQFHQGKWNVLTEGCTKHLETVILL